MMSGPRQAEAGRAGAWGRGRSENGPRATCCVLLGGFDITVWRNRTKVGFCIMIAWFMSRTVEGFVRYPRVTSSGGGKGGGLKGPLGGGARNFFVSPPP